MIEFDLPIRGTNYWYRVTIFRTKQQMQKAVKEAIRNGEIDGDRSYGSGDFLAQVSWRRKMLDGSSGWIVFCRRAIGAGIVSHEMTHAALYHVMWRELRQDFGKKTNDERLAYIQGGLTRDFWCKWYEQKDEV